MHIWKVFPDKKSYASPWGYSLDYDDVRQESDKAYVDGWNACRDEMHKKARELYWKVLQEEGL